MKPPSFSSLQEGKEKICYPTIAKNTRMMDVLAEMQQQEVLAVLRKRERTERRILIGVMFIITSVIIAIFVATMAAFVAIKHYEHYGSPSTFRVRPGVKLSKDFHSHHLHYIDSSRKHLNASPLVALSPRANSTDKQLKGAAKEPTSHKDEKSKPFTNTTPLPNSPKDEVETDIKISDSTVGDSVTASPRSLKLRVLSKSLKEFDDPKKGNSTNLDLETESPVTILPDAESSKEKRADEITEDDETKESTEVYISASTSSPPTMKSVRVSSTSQPSSSSLFGLVSRRGYSLESPFVSTTLGLPSRRSASTFTSGASTTSSTGSSFIPPGNVWSFESPLQMISSARNWLQQRGFLNS